METASSVHVKFSSSSVSNQVAHRESHRVVCGVLCQAAPEGKVNRGTVLLFTEANMYQWKECVGVLSIFGIKLKSFPPA